MVVAQEYINRYRSARHDTSLDEVLDDGQQFAARKRVSAWSMLVPRLRRRQNWLRWTQKIAFCWWRLLLDRRTLAEIAADGRARVTISRSERATSALRKRIRKRMMQSGMSPRQADEAMQDVDVRDLRVNVNKTLRQETGNGAFYKEKDECG